MREMGLRARYVRLLEAIQGIEASCPLKASPWQNAFIESVHALIKGEWLYQ